MLLEDILLAAAIGVALVLVGWPVAQVLRVAPWRKRDPVAEAKERLRVAKLDAEAARLNREAERIYDDLYKDALTDEEPLGDIEKGKGHGDQ
jgi:hypothetical protein